MPVIVVLVLMAIAWKALKPKPDLAALYLFNKDYLEDWKRQVEEWEERNRETEADCEYCFGDKTGICCDCKESRMDAREYRGKYELALGYFKTYGELPEKFK